VTRVLNESERGQLLRLARDTIASHLEGRREPELDVSGGPLAEPRGAFVTLKIAGELRGCIGHVTGVEALWRSVRSNARAAAFRDPRFQPLRPEELDAVVIEVSALSPLERLEDPSDLEIGRDGLLVERGRFRGLLLPQVATEYGWDGIRFLDQTCRKAGLPAGCWRDAATRIYTFSVDSFSEEPGGPPSTPSSG
jgi:AmmeMemoRadiSam system protein A